MYTLESVSSINSKSQTLNPKQIPITNYSKSKQEKNRNVGPYSVSNFVFSYSRSCFEFRIIYQFTALRGGCLVEDDPFFPLSRYVSALAGIFLEFEPMLRMK